MSNLKQLSFNVNNYVFSFIQTEANKKNIGRSEFINKIVAEYMIRQGHLQKDIERDAKPKINKSFTCSALISLK